MRLIHVASAIAFALGVAGCAALQEAPPYPTQPVKLIAPYPAGNAADLVGRIVAEKPVSYTHLTLPTN